MAPCLAPRWFGRLLNIPVDTDPRLPVMVRSVGVRDAAIGLGLLVAALRHRDYSPWLLARVAADSDDSVAVALAIAAGARQPRFVGLGLLALGATATGLLLRGIARRLQVESQRRALWRLFGPIRTSEPTLLVSLTTAPARFKGGQPRVCAAISAFGRERWVARALRSRRRVQSSGKGG